MLKHRLFIAFFASFLILLGPLYTLAFCVLENEIAAKNSSQDPSSISCVDDEKTSFLSAAYPTLKKIHFLDMQKTAGSVYHAVFSQEQSTYPAIIRLSGTVHVPFLIPIYQFTSVYRI